ncbi:MAG: DUF6410 domain-containing protein [Nocardioidaceae bacterium]
MDRRTIGVAGTIARAIVGIVLILIAVLTGFGWADVVGAVVVLPVIALASALLLNRLPGSMLRRARVPWSGAQILAAVAVIVTVMVTGTVLTFVSPMNGAALLLLFFGGSMLLAAAVGYDGCEVLALPNFVFVRRDAIWCPVYSPLDHAENGHDAH